LQRLDLHHATAASAGSKWSNTPISESDFMAKSGTRANSSFMKSGRRCVYRSTISSEP